MINTDLENASKIMIGSLEVEAIYVGSTLIWLSILLPYDAEIEYISPNNNAYIHIDMQYTSQQLDLASYIEYITDCTIYESTTGAEGKNNTYFFVGVSNNKYYSGLGGIYHTSNTTNDLNKHRLKLTKENNTVNFYLDNIVIDTYSYNNSHYSLDGFNLFNCDNFNVHLTKLRKYYSKLTIDDNVIFETIPVRVGLVGYMYDKISGQLFGNNGTGDFVLGPDKN